ncbi:MAG: hypothetical protein A2953_00360 [Candidatus Levybacteria bacterium RIFCSPLOWO2_01_FULL_36_54]|nr:MAG: hypothetical protein A3C97_01760 [Candidatus Levybacteria bacterium RIFCSPHIGHO2_02_FULL_37_11]OGH33140.1 MAG: hypothetical protein A2953_00360 [Candidatus Levybacteria bacterium RIFCSPLOWO2_01_FULL_36_54]
MNIKSKNGDLEYYVSLIFILSLGLFFIILAAPNKNLQLILVLLTTLFHILFGIVHHLINHDLRIRVVVQYIVIGALGITVIFFFLKGGLGF